ncbi:energy transducer TonB [Aquifex pyrophilus]
MVNRHLLAGLFVSALIHTFLFFSFAKINLSPRLKEEKKYVKLSLNFVKLKKEVKKKKVLKTTKKKVKKVVKKKMEKIKQKKKRYAKRSRKVIKRKVLKKTERKIVRRKVERNIKPSGEKKVKGEIAVKPSVKEKTQEVKEVKNKDADLSEKVAYAKKEIRINEEKEFLEENLSLIRNLVLENLTYPYIARRMGWEGTVVISFFLSEKGCDEVKVERSSGFEVLDNEAKNTVEKLCGKFPKPKTRVLVKLPVKFILKD